MNAVDIGYVMGSALNGAAQRGSRGGSQGAVSASSGVAGGAASAVSGPLSPTTTVDSVEIGPSFPVSQKDEDYLPQASKEAKKKKFKSVRQYVQYMVALMTRYVQLKPPAGELFVKEKDKAEFARLDQELKDMAKASVGRVDLSS